MYGEAVHERAERLLRERVGDAHVQQALASLSESPWPPGNEDHLPLCSHSGFKKALQSLDSKHLRDRETILDFRSNVGRPVLKRAQSFDSGQVAYERASGRLGSLDFNRTRERIRSDDSALTAERISRELCVELSFQEELCIT